MFHQNSLNGKLQTLLESKVCICNDSKQPNKPFCYSCFKELEDKDFKVNRLYRSGESFFEAFDEAIEELGYKI